MPLHLHRLFSLALSASVLLLAPSANAATPTTTQPAVKPAAKSVAPPAAKPAPRPAQRPTAKAAPVTSRQQADNTAKGLALATATVEAISAGQLDVAARVLTGAADCEFNQRITVAALHGQPGYFTVSHLGRHYRMLPRETSTGAVRLEDPANGIVWLQIPAKSMLMNARRGQRMVDSCMHAEQRAAVAAVTEAGQGIGIVAPVAAAAPAVAVAPGIAASAAAASAPATGASASAAAASAPATAASASATAASASALVEPATQAVTVPALVAPTPPAAADAAPPAPAPAASAP